MTIQTWNMAAVNFDIKGGPNATSTTSKLQLTGKCRRYLKRLRSSSVIEVVSWKGLCSYMKLIQCDSSILLFVYIVH